jgi:hypothetical protein
VSTRADTEQGFDNFNGSSRLTMICEGGVLCRLRGIRGRVEVGKSGGGLCYGYQVRRVISPGEPAATGDREIVQVQAEVIRRIFRDYAAGVSPMALAKRVNAEHVPGPGGAGWNPSTIHGNPSRGTGVLNNELYIGRLVWNRLR